MTNTLRILILSAIAASGLISCENPAGNQGATQPSVKAPSDSTENARRQELQKIFFSIPSPVEMASLVKDKGYHFDVNMLNKTEHVSKYTGEVKQAVNLGIYGADLSYAAIFDEKQVTMNYFAGAQKLASQLGIENVLTGELIERLEKNQESRDSLLTIVSDAYADLNSYLKENDRSEVAALVVSGGWLEALYLSTIYAKDNNPDIRKRIAEQKYALNNLIDYFGKFGEKESLTEMKADLESLRAIYNGTNEAKGKTTQSKDEGGTVVIGTSTVLSISDETLKAIETKVTELRNKYTSI